MTISYIIPHKNRTSLLFANLQSLATQSCTDFEVIIVDSSSAHEVERLKHFVAAYRAKGMKIRGYITDPSAHPFSHATELYGGAYNPALAQNIGVKKTSGEIICLTSPEVINASTNVENAINLFSDGHSRFALGWIDERPLHVVGAIGGGISIERMKELCKVPGNAAMCRDDVPSRPWFGENYFLGLIRKDDYIRVGGMEERFMRSIAYEDNFFAQCCSGNGFAPQFASNIAGIHLSHSRSYQENLDNENKVLWNKLKGAVFEANRNVEWGEFVYIKDEF